VGRRKESSLWLDCELKRRVFVVEKEIPRYLGVLHAILQYEVLCIAAWA
jgi:hypothetical protein